MSSISRGINCKSRDFKAELDEFNELFDELFNELAG